MTMPTAPCQLLADRDHRRRDGAGKFHSPSVFALYSLVACVLGTTTTGMTARGQQMRRSPSWTSTVTAPVYATDPGISRSDGRQVWPNRNEQTTQSSITGTNRSSAASVLAGNVTGSLRPMSPGQSSRRAPTLPNQPNENRRSVATQVEQTQQNQHGSVHLATVGNADLADGVVAAAAFRTTRSSDPTAHYNVPMVRWARETAAHYQSIAERAPDVVAGVAEENARLVDQWAKLAEAYMNLAQRAHEASASLATSTQDLQDTRNKITTYGLTPTVGMLLRQKKEQLNDWHAQDSQSRFTSQELALIRQQQLELEIVPYSGVDPAGEAYEILVAAGYDQQSTDFSSLASQIESLLSQRAQWIERLHQGYHDYQHKLNEFDSSITASTQLIHDYRTLIDRHITWIRSGTPLGFDDFSQLKGGIAALFDLRRSQDFGPTIERKLKSETASAIGLVALIVVIAFMRWRAKTWLIAIGTKKRMEHASASTRRAVAGAFTVIVAIAFPAILWAVGRWFGSGIVSESTLHAASGFMAASLVALTFELPRQLIRTYGYLDKHVDLDLPNRQRAMGVLTLAGLALVVAAYAITVMGSIDHGMWRDSLGRFGFLLAMLVVAWVVHFAFRPNGGFVEPLIARVGGDVMHRMRWVIYLMAMGFTLSMMGLSVLGYGYTARELLERTMLTVSAALIAGPLWIGIKVVSASAWHRLTVSTESTDRFDRQQRNSDESEVGEGTLGQHNLELKYQLAFLCQCVLVLGLIAAGGWLWIDVFPNVQMGNPVLWTIQDSAIETRMNSEGNMVAESVLVSTPITLLHGLMAAATLFVAFQLAKLLPALFDALVLQRVSFDEAMEHFSLVLGRCLLFGAGCVIAGRLLGIRWQTIQWLAVGLTIGLGFGLQDMVRNVFGGLVVLFEKPAKLGDRVTVGRFTGRIAHQRLRTTVLADDEGRELIIPNRNFVHEEVVNWMGAGRLQPIVMEVAVNRHERPADICRKLQEAALAQPEVVLTPPPQSTLVCVAKRSQRIEVRAWIDRSLDPLRVRDQLLRVLHDQLKNDQLLIADQPPQPELPIIDEFTERSGRARTHRSNDGPLRRRRA